MLNQLRNLCRPSIIFRAWINQALEIKEYWTIFGGISAFVKSPYPAISIAIGLIIVIFGKSDFDPSNLTISIIPNLLGFTIGAMAIILAFSSSDLFTTISEDGNPKSLFIKLVSNFVHFIIIQSSAIIIAILFNAFQIIVFKVCSSILLIYAILSTLSTGIQLFQVARVANIWQSIPKNNKNL